jgi:phosphate transport system substrate-binding protein
MEVTTMQLVIERSFCALLVATVLMVLGCNGSGSGTTSAPAGGSEQLSDLQGEINIDGSSTVYKLSQAAAEMFGEVSPDVAVTVKYAGTGGGFKNFVKGDLDICDASRPIQEKEMALCKENGIEYMELPVAFDALTIAVNAQNDWAETMTVEELKKLWEPAAEGKVLKWSDVRDGWPNEKITLHGAGTDSGTFEYFTEAIMQKKNASRSDYSASENDNIIIQSIEGDKFALGYVPYPYYEPRKSTLKAVKIDSGAGPVQPSPATVMDGTYHPLSRPLFIYVNLKSAERPAVKAFVDYYVKNAASIANAVKYIPLPDSAYPIVGKRFDTLQVGTAFGGHSDTAVKFEEVLKREPKL